MKKIRLLTIILFVPIYALTQIVTWDGGAGTEYWEDDKNWSTDLVPCTTCDVVIPDSVVLQSQQEIRSLKLLTGAKPAVLMLTNTAVLEMTSPAIGIDMETGTRLWNYGGIGIYGGTNGIETREDNYVYNDGEILISNCTVNGVLLEENSIFENNSDLDIEYGSGNGLFIISDPTSQFQNSGNLKIRNMGGFGISNAGQFLNEGIVTLSHTSNLSINNLNDFINSSSSSIIITNSNSTSVSNEGFFQNFGSLQVTDAGSNGLWQKGGTFLNKSNGNIQILNAQNDAILVESTSLQFENESLASVLIDSTVNYGLNLVGQAKNFGNISLNKSSLFCKDDFENLGNLEISNSSEISIENSPLSQLVNAVSGTITIQGASNFSLTNQGKFENNGSFFIQNCLRGSIENNAQFENTGLVQIKNLQSYGFQNYGEISNFESGVLEIDSINSVGIRSYGRLENRGEFKISNTLNTGLLNGSTSDSLINSGTIAVSKTSGFSAAIDNVNALLFVNQSSGQIRLDSTYNGFSNTGNFHNYGTVTIDANESSCLNNQGNVFNDGLFDFNNTIDGISGQASGTLINSINGVIKITENVMTGINGRFPIENNGTISIKNTSGFSYSNKSTFINNGVLDISNSSSTGFYNQTGAVFFNNPAGLLSIDSCVTSGIVLNSPMTNKGEIQIDQIGNRGINIVNASDSIKNEGSIQISNAVTGVSMSRDGIFINSGMIKIDSVSDKGFNSNRKLINTGIIDVQRCATGLSFFITDSVLNYGKMISLRNNEGLKILGTGIFVNTECGGITTENDLTFSNSITFLNNGYFKQKNSTSFLNGPFINKGILDDSLHTIISFSNFQNMGLILQSIYGGFSEGVKELPVFIAGSSPLHTINSTWWTDEAHTVAAGTFLDSDFSFTPNSLALASNEFWLEATALPLSCVQNIQVYTLPQGCVSQTIEETLTFTGTISDDWHVPGNWDNNKIPAPCSRVIVPNGVNCSIYGGRKARAFDIRSESGSVLDIQNGVVLEVTPY